MISFEEMQEEKSLFRNLRGFVEFKSGGPARYIVEQIFAAFLGWIPGLPGLVLRWFLYRLLVSGSGWIAIERGVEIFGTKWVTLGKGIYLGEGVILQGRPGGLKIGDGVRIMSRAVLNVYNYRGLEHSGIEIGKGSVIGIQAVITGQGLVKIGEDVIVAPGAKIMPVNHLYSDPGRPIKDQGIQANGITIKKGAWIGAGAIVLDSVEIGENAVAAAGAVVTESVPSGSVVAGNPAQPAKGRGQ